MTRVKAECLRQPDPKVKMVRKMSRNHYLKSEKSKVKRIKQGALIIDTPKPRAENRDPKQRMPCAISGKSHGTVGTMEVSR